MPADILREILSIQLKMDDLYSRYKDDIYLKTISDDENKKEELGVIYKKYNEDINILYRQILGKIAELKSEADKRVAVDLLKQIKDIYGI